MRAPLCARVNKGGGLIKTRASQVTLGMHGEPHSQERKGEEGRRPDHGPGKRERETPEDAPNRGGGLLLNLAG
jgi:hypothetical protein